MFLTDQNIKNYDVTRVTRRVSHVEREALIPPDHLSSPLIFSGVGVALSLVFCVMFYRSSFVHLFFWPLFCLSFFDFRFLLVFQTFFYASMKVYIEKDKTDALSTQINDAHFLVLVQALQYKG
jgi:hypothetical protein